MKIVKDILRLLTEEFTADGSDFDVSDFIIKSFKSNGIAILNINSLIYNIFDYFEGELSNGFIYSLGTEKDVREKIDNYIMNNSLPSAAKIDL